jgi:CHAT domain-containing protein/Tfp pilus assembly protein PilF
MSTGAAGGAWQRASACLRGAALSCLAALAAFCAAGVAIAGVAVAAAGSAAAAPTEAELLQALQSAEQRAAAAPDAVTEELRAAVAALAFHYAEAQRPKESMAFATRGAQLAQALHARAPTAATTVRVGSALRQLARAHVTAGDFPAAIRDARRAVEWLDALDPPDARESARAYNQLGSAQYRAGQYRDALANQRRALALLEQIGVAEDPDVAFYLHDVAELQMAAGDLDAAVDTATRCLQMWRRLKTGPHADLGRALQTLARIHRDRGELAQADRLFEEAAAVTESVRGPDHMDLAAVLNNHALALQQKGDFEAARVRFERSLRIREATLGERHTETATGLNNLALLYWTLGDYARALDLYESALDIDRDNLGPDHPYVVTTVHNIGNVLIGLRRFDEAQARLDETHAARRRALGDDHPLVAQGLSVRARLQFMRGNYAEAKEGFVQSLAIYAKRVGPLHPQSVTLQFLLARTRVALGEAEAALADAQTGYANAVRSGLGGNAVWFGPYVLSLVHAALAQDELAVFWGKQAVNGIQSLRVGLAAFDRSTQRAFVEDRRAVYLGLIDLLVAQDRLAEAQEVYRLLKEEEYFDFILRDAGTQSAGGQMPFNGRVETDADAALTALRARIRQHAAELTVLDRRARLGLSEAEQQRRAAARLELDRAAAELDAFLAALSARFASPRPAQRAERAPVPSAGASQGVAVAPGVARLQYVVSESRVLILLTTEQGRSVHEQRIARVELARQIDAFRRAIRDLRDTKPAARGLHAWLVAPVADRLAAARVHTLELSLDGALRYLPFSALHDGERYLVQRYALALVAEGVAAAAPRETDARWELEGFGLTRALPGFVALPGVRRELDEIRRRVAAGELWLDEQFTRERLLRRDSPRRPLLHIATHFTFRPGTEIDSALLMGDGTRVSLRELRLASLDLRGVRVLTLSACDTATGGGYDETGREVEGLAALLHERGARRVVATLWPVADGSTASLMPAMYTQLVERGQPLAQALRAAQLAAIDGGAGLFGRSRREAHPFHWAGFVAVGGT